LIKLNNASEFSWGPFYKFDEEEGRKEENKEERRVSCRTLHSQSHINGASFIFPTNAKKFKLKARRISAEMAASHSLIKLKTRRKGKWILVDGSAKQARTQPLGRAGPAASGRKGPGRVAQPRPPPHRYHGGSV
jgi:hypothetical protein